VQSLLQKNLSAVKMNESFHKYTHSRRLVLLVVIISIFSLPANSDAAAIKKNGWSWERGSFGNGGGEDVIDKRRGKRAYYEDDELDRHGDRIVKQSHISGLGREFNLFRNSIDSPPLRGGEAKPSSPSFTAPRRSSRSKRHSVKPPLEPQPQRFNPFSSVHSWVRSHQADIPRIQIRLEPQTTLKLRKTFRPFFKTLCIFGADFNTQLGVWQFRSSWEDSIIGSRLTLSGRELQLSKAWLLSIGAADDLVTRLRLRAAIDLGTGKAYARFGFRQERLSAINVVEGFTLLRQVNLDGPKGHVKMEVKANFAFPEPEIEYSTERGGNGLVGMGDIEINVDEVNLLLDY